MREAKIDEDGVRLQRSNSSSLSAASPPPALTFQQLGSLNHPSPLRVLVTGVSDQCRRRKGWKQEEDKDAIPWSAHDRLAQDINRVPTVTEQLGKSKNFRLVKQI